MKKVFTKKIVSFVLSALIIICGIPMEAQAAEECKNIRTEEVLSMVPIENVDGEMGEKVNAKAILYNCFISVNSSSSGMRVSFMTDCSQNASIIGVKDVVIKQKVWYGWKTVATSVGGAFNNTSTYMGAVLYTNAIKGEEYRITCTHYADADEYVEVHGELDVVFTY